MKTFSFALLFFLQWDIHMAKAFTHHFVDWSFKNIQVIDLISIPTTKNQAEISDLSWDTENKQLYGITDKGRLIYFNFAFNQAKINQLDIIKTVKLKNKKGQFLSKNKRDSEGMTGINSSPPTVAVSFERIPKVRIYNLDGELQKNIKLPKMLRDIKHYRSANRALEAIIKHPKYGLITAPERSLKKDPVQDHHLYQIKGKKEWTFRAYPKKNSSITALEVLNNGHLLVLERAVNKKAAELFIILRDVELHKDGHCTVKVLAEFNSHDHWPIDNFEGLTALGNNLYLMVSDNGNSSLQQTLFMLFKVTQ